MKKTLILLGLMAGTTHATIFDLNTDFSNASNPNGTWSFTSGSTALNHFATPGDPNNLNLATTNGMWALASGSFNASVFKTTGGTNLTTVYTANDFVAGDVLVHSTTPNTGGDLFINWIAPQAGTITYTGGVWYAHSPVTRSQDYFVTFNGGANLNSGTLTVAQNRSNIQAINSAGSISVQAGDKLSLRLAPTAGQSFGSLSGVNFSVNLTPSSATPEPATFAVAGGALLVMLAKARRK